MERKGNFPPYMIAFSLTTDLLGTDLGAIGCLQNTLTHT